MNVYRRGGLLVGMLIAAQGALAQDSSCPEGRAPAGDVGIRRLGCIGPSASCVIYERDQDGSVRHEFSVEPVIAETASDNSSGALRQGDRIVAVDSLLITTTEGGRHFANLPINQPVRVLVRHDGELVERVVTTRRGCGVLGLTVRTRSHP